MSKQEELEQKIKEKRLIEANKKGIVGQNGKIGIVLKILGQPILSQSEGNEYIDTYYLEKEEDNYDQSPKNAEELLSQIPVMGSASNDRPNTEEWSNNVRETIECSTQTIGWHFCGLSNGMHLEIKYDNYYSELSVIYKGYLVYRESKGEIDCYVPVDEWEKWIESLYKIAKDKQRKKREEEFNEKLKIAEQNKNSWWQEMKKKWGITS